MTDFVVNNTQFNNQARTNVEKHRSRTIPEYLLIMAGLNSANIFEFDLGDVDNDGAKDIAVAYQGRPLCL
jgi:hypothetical protein